MVYKDFEEFCGSPIWDWNITWYTAEPDFTPCFHKTVMILIPSLFLLTFGILRFIFKTGRISKNIPWTYPNVLKAVICLFLGILQCVRLFYEIGLTFLWDGLSVVELLGAAVEALTYGCAFLIGMNFRAKRYESSDGLFTFWFLKFLCEAIRFRSFLRNFGFDQNMDVVRSLVLAISFPLVISQFLLHCWADDRTTTKFENDPTNDELLSNPFCPRRGASPLSRLFFQWFNSFVYKGYKQPLETTDMWELDPELKSSEISQSFTEECEKFQNGGNERKRKISLLPILFRAFGTEFLWGSGLKIAPDLLVFVSPQILNLLILFVNGEEELWKGYFYAALLFITNVVITLTMNHHTHLISVTTFKVKSALTNAIYRKALTISNAARKGSSAGKIVNLMTGDIQTILNVAQSINILWSAPLQILLSMYFLWLMIGASALAGLGVMCLLFPANSIITKKLGGLYGAQKKIKDERIKLMSEIISGAKVVKLHAWEPSFEKRVLDIRGKELKILKRIAYFNTCNDFLWNCTPFLVMLATFGTFVLVSGNNTMDARTAFVALALLNVMLVPLTTFPKVVVSLVDAQISFKRLNKFLNSQDKDPEAVTRQVNDDDPITIQNGSFTWDSEPAEEGQRLANVLKEINLRVRKGSLVAVVGQVGSGKSSLLSALLGELNKTFGQVNVVGRVSYAAQLPWIQNDTLRENILFGNPFNVDKYNQVVESCCLNPDMDIFPGRDRIEIGEKGINLSGGQKQRVSIARAVYNEADIYLFDDPLSALDAHIAKHIFDKTLGPKSILKGKTRVLVTHSVAFLPQVDHIIVLKNGRISESGSYQQLLSNNREFASFAAEFLSSDQAKIIEGLSGGIKCCTPTERCIQHFESKTNISRDSAVSFKDAQTPMSSTILLSKMTGPAPEAQNLITKETSETKSIPWSIYSEYFRAAGWHWAVITLLAFATFQAFAVGSNYWLSVWSESQVTEGMHVRREYYIGIYAVLGLGQSLAFITATLLMSLACLRSARTFHSKMLSRILRAPMSFFDTTPSGRLLNRFTQDVGALDSSLPFPMRFWMNIFVQVLGSLTIIVCTLPMFGIAVIPLVALFFWVQKFYIPTARQIKRFDSASRSPIISHFTETLNGVQTIRAYGHEQRFVSKAEREVDAHLRCFLPSVVSLRWLTIRLESLGNIVIFLTALFAVWSRETLHPGSVGLAITYALNITCLLTLFVRNFCEVETNIVAAERIMEYWGVPQEDPWESIQKPAPEWPQRGAVEFRNYETKYRAELDPVLKNVSFEILPGEKVGVVGRTGAGKSTLTLALFRIIEALKGCVVIDGVNVSKIGLHALRSKLTIIPQDPVLFSGSIRSNLDPCEEHSDSEIWKALESAHLTKFITELEHIITEDGGNLSVGQKQLVCLARALLRKSKILILDEATAAVDLETDALIQGTIRTEFIDSTVITIAHRLNTVLGCNRILVLHDGVVHEFDTPANLRDKLGSKFTQLENDACFDYKE